jgi:hypothetical protein
MTIKHSIFKFITPSKSKNQIQPLESIKIEKTEPEEPINTEQLTSYFIQICKQFDYQYMIYYDSKYKLKHVVYHKQIGKMINQLKPEIAHQLILKYVCKPELLYQTKIAMIEKLFEYSNYNYTPSHFEKQFSQIQNLFIRYNPCLIYVSGSETYRIKGLLHQEPHLKESFVREFWKELEGQIEFEKKILEQLQNIVESDRNFLYKELYKWCCSKYSDASIELDPDFQWLPIEKSIIDIKKALSQLQKEEEIHLILNAYQEIYDLRLLVYVFNSYIKEHNKSWKLLSLDLLYK